MHAIERLAHRSGKSELAVAQTLLDLMRQSPPQAEDAAAAAPAAARDAEPGSANAEAHGSVASHWLRGPGRAQLLQALGLPEGLALQWARWRPRLAFPAYLLALALGTAWLTAWVLTHRGDGAASLGTGLGLLTVLLMLLPASEAVVAVVNRLISESARPRRLPRLALAEAFRPNTGCWWWCRPCWAAKPAPPRWRTACTCTTLPTRRRTRSSRC